MTSSPAVDEALVLSVLAYGEKDAVVDLLARDHGRLSVFANRAYGRQPRFGAALQPYCRVEAEWRPGRAPGRLGSLTRLDLLAEQEGLRSGLPRLALAAFAAEAVRCCCPEGQAVPETYQLLGELLAELDVRPATPALWLAWMLQLLDRLGYGPELERCVGCGAVPPPERPVLIVAEQGGVLCAACRGGGAASLTARARLLAPRSRAVLQALRVSPLAVAAPLELAGPALDQPRRVLLELLETLIGHRLRSLPLLEEFLLGQR